MAKTYAQYLHELNVKRAGPRFPKWVESSPQIVAEILAIYEQKIQLCSALERFDRRWWNVDHEVPLHGRTVSGLHVPWNLRVIEADKNIAKNNQWPLAEATT